MIEKDLHNLEFLNSKTINEILLDSEPRQILVESKTWYTFDDPTYSSMEQYGFYFEKLILQINDATKEKASEVTVDENWQKKWESAADIAFHWEKSGIILTYEHQDKELPIIIGLIKVV